ncbi:THP1 [Sanghuangporus sanghuang]
MTQPTEDVEEEVKIEEERTSTFRLKLEEFSFESPQTSPVRRSTRSSNLILTTTERSPGTPNLVSETSSTVAKKRSNVSIEDESPTKTKKKRGYAPPETYAHLNYLTDCLREYLDVLFCGINPGVHSATVGHHFAHPGNRFYKMLHGSGFTDRLIPPEQDSTLPALYNIGITDIVDRPSSCVGLAPFCVDIGSDAIIFSQEDELSAQEMIGGVPALLQKVAKCKPRFVYGFPFPITGMVTYNYRNKIRCFIGKGMGQRVEKGFRREIIKSRSQLEPCEAGPGKQKRGTSPTKVTRRQTNSDVDNGIGLRPYKVTHNDPESPVHETLFFVSHSSSGLATSMNLQGKIDLLKELRGLIEKHKAGTVDTSSLEEVPILTDTPR